MLGVWISVSCFGSTPLKLFVGLGVQASKETARKLNFYKKLVLKSLPDYNRNIIPDYIKNTVGYCFHNNREQTKS